MTGLPGHGFRLFDDRDVHRMHCTPEGKFTGGELLPTGRLRECRGYRGLALTRAMPFAAYGERHH
ncbi:DUF6879 family protein [Streptomyces sp. NPDC006367]|uniref:DUF6879 family protein n=1 Tax=unclassified Streptomyces TaxID=2593676 RepID=UPI0033AD282A